MLAGWADALITPPPGTSLAGFAARHGGAQGVHDDLYARALVLEEAGVRAALVALDLCEVDSKFVEVVRSRISQATRLSQDAVIVAATHTHAAPATFPRYSAPPDPAWLASLPDRIAGAVSSACDALSPATLSIGVGREMFVGRNRRRPDGPVDPTVTILAAARADAPTAMLIHYACHPTVLGPDNLSISRDFPGAAVDVVARTTGGWAAFLNGACGDINVGHAADRSALGLAIPGRTFERADALGHRLASTALGALAAAAPLAGPLRVLRRSLEVPRRATPPLEEMRAQVAASRDHVQSLQSRQADEAVLTAARLDLLYAELGLSWVEQRDDAAAEVVEIQVLIIGDLAIVALPGEFFAESGLRLRARSPNAHTIVVGYANGEAGYVPPASAFAEGGYETRLAPSSRLAAEAETMILDAAVALLHSGRA